MTREELAHIVRTYPSTDVAKLFGYLQTHDVEKITAREADDMVVAWGIERERNEVLWWERKYKRRA